MADRIVEFDAETVLKKLLPYERTQVKYAGGRALRRLGYQIRNHVNDHMATLFDNPVPYTTSATRYLMLSDSELKLSINREGGGKGQDPGRYLYPVSTDDTQGVKTAYTTRFTRALRAKGVVGTDYYARPWLPGRGLPKLNQYGNVPASFYSATLAGVERKGAPGNPRTKQSGWRYFSVPDQRHSAATLTGSNNRKPGIYRVKAGDLQMLFIYSKKQTTVPTIFDWYGLVSSAAAEQFPRLLRLELDLATQ